jgi:hypothetical protein
LLAWDDSSTVYGRTEEQQARQRTVKDFLAYVLGLAGQEQVTERDLSPLPAALLADAREGQLRVGWTKKPSDPNENAIKGQIKSASKHSES